MYPPPLPITLASSPTSARISSRVPNGIVL
jgi:hypothetical protein